MKFKKVMLVTFLLLAILTIGAVSASDDVGALAVEDTGDEVIEAPVDDASLEVDEMNDVLEDDSKVDIALEDEISSANDKMVTVTDSNSDRVYGTVTIFLNDTQVVQRFFGGSYTSEKVYANKISGSFEGTYNMRVVYHSNTADKDYSNEGVVTFTTHIENKVVSAEDFNFTLVNSEVDIKSENTPIITFQWPEGTSDQESIELHIKDTFSRQIPKQGNETSGVINIANLYIWEPGTFEFTAYYRDNDNYMTKLSNGTFTVTKTFTAKDFIEIYSKQITSPTDYVCNVFDSYGNLNGEVTVLVNNAQVYNKKFTGSPQSIRINWNNLTGDLKGECDVKVIYKRAANGKEYSRLETITFGDSEPEVPDNRPTMTFKFNAEDIVYGNDAVVRVTAYYDYNKVNETFSDTILVEVLYSNGMEYVIADKANVLLKKGVGTVRFSNLNVTSDGYVLFVNASDTDTYKVNFNSKSFKVNPAEINVDNLDDINLLYGESANVTVSAEGATGIEVLLDGSPLSVEGFLIQLSGLSLGPHDLDVTPLSDSNHIGVNKSVKIYVEKAEAFLNTSDIIIYGGSATQVTLDVDGADSISAEIHGSPIEVNGNVVSIPALSMGNHIMTVTVNPDENHNGITRNITIVVKKHKSDVSLSNHITFDYNASGSTTMLLINATEVDAKIVDHPEAVVNVNGNEITVSNLTPGNYVLEVTTIVDADHETATAHVNVTVKRLMSGVSLSDDITFDYGLNGSTNMLLSGATNVTAEVVGCPDAVIDIDYNNNLITVSNLNAGSYTLVVKTDVDTRFYDVGTDSVNITVNKIASGLLLGGDISFDYGSAGVVSYSSNVEIAAGIIDHPEADVTINGGIKVSNLNAGKYTLLVMVKDGAENYDVPAVAVNVTVNPLSSLLSPTSVKTTYGTSKWLYVTVTSNGTAVSGKTVTVVINKVPYTAVTLANGVAKVATPKALAANDKKAYAVSVSLSDKNYVASTATTSILVKRATPIMQYKAAKFKRTDKAKQYVVVLRTDKKALYNGKIAIKVGGKTYSVKTVKGKAVFKFTKLTKKGKYVAVIKYGGDSKYAPLTKKVNIVVK